MTCDVDNRNKFDDFHKENFKINDILSHNCEDNWRQKERVFIYSE